ncbi:MAG: restriction endonuclease, partial [Gemmataceae bacterium]|nr:restriction endonuclease [Gemmataceae bacterium]
TDRLCERPRPSCANFPKISRTEWTATTDADGNVERLAIFTALPTARQLAENPYHDRIEGDVFVFTGAGRSGDQSVTGPNARIREQRAKPFPIYGFLQIVSRRDPTIGSRRWRFIGLLEYLRCFRERQLDALGEWRNAWAFELRLLGEIELVKIDEDLALANEVLGRLPTSSEDDLEVVNPAEESGSTPIVLEELEPIRRQLLAYEPREFEFVIQNLLQQSGFSNVEVTKFSKDGGIDVNAKPGLRSWPMRQVLLQLQAKRWLHTVGRKEIAELRGSLKPHTAGCIVTTSHFSRAALAEAVEPGKVPIAAIDGYELASIIKQLKLELPKVPTGTA